MSAEKLKKLILSLTCDIEFEYKGIHGGILPFSCDNIVVFWGEEEEPPEEICNEENIMECRIIDGVPLKNIAEELDLY